MNKLLFLTILFFLSVALLTHLAILPPPSPKNRLEKQFTREESREDQPQPNRSAGKGIFQKRHLEFNSVRQL